jgi:kynurenine formamidase
VGPRLRPVLPLLALVLAGCGSGARPAETAGPVGLASARVVDLSHSFNAATVYWPTEQDFRREVTAEGMTDRGYYYASGTITTPEHGGTHLDAPIHFAEGAHTSDRIPLERLIGPAAVVDVSGPAAEDADYRITVADLESWEAEHGRIPDGAIVLFRTGFDAYWGDRARYMGTAERGADAVALLHFPGLHPDAAEWLVRQRAVDAVGIDTPSIDYGQSQAFRSHRILFAENVPAFENVANLDRLPPTGSLVVALPMKIEGGSGGPLRIVAFLP